MPPLIKTENESERPQLDAPPAALADGEEFDDDEGDEEFLDNESGVNLYQDGDFKITQIEEANIVKRKLKDLYDLSKTPFLNLSPEYQREVVWDDTRASGLISSIIQGYFIPPIIFNVISKAEKGENGRKLIRHYRICVDGKQRISSVIKFMEGKIGVSDSAGRKWFYDHPIVKGVRQNTSHSILPEFTKAEFRQRYFTCYEFGDLNAQVEENMFQLVQRGMPLTIAEKLRALSTKWANFTKQYETDYSAIVNLVKQGRASAFRSVITIFCQILEVESPSGKGKNRESVAHKPILQASPGVLQKLLKDDKMLDEGTKSKFKQVFDKYQRLFELSSERSSHARSGRKLKLNSAFSADPDYLRERDVGHVKTFAPIELLGTAILISVHMGKRTDQMLLGDIKEMRHFLRENHRDLRINQQCWVTVWEYIETVMIQRRGGEGAAPQQRRQRPNAEVISSDDEPTNTDPEELFVPPGATGDDGHVPSPYFPNQSEERSQRATRRFHGASTSTRGKRTNLALREPSDNNHGGKRMRPSD